MAGNALKLAAFLALAQHEVQQTLEYLAQPEVRKIGSDTPSQVLATVGNIKMTVPLQFAIARSPQLGAGPSGQPALPAEILLPGAPWPPGSRVRYQINVATVQPFIETCLPSSAFGTLQVEFITVLKH